MEDRYDDDSSRMASIRWLECARQRAAAGAQHDAPRATLEKSGGQTSAVIVPPFAGLAGALKER